MSVALSRRVRLAGALLLVVVAACVTQASFKARMDALVGRSEADLLAQLGAPQHVEVSSDGSRALTYVAGETMAQGLPQSTLRPTGRVYGGPSGVMSPSATMSSRMQDANSVTLSCTTIFRIVGDRIESWRAQGNSCLAD